MPRLKPTFRSHDSTFPLQEFLDYGSGKRSVYAAHAILTLCRFGRLLSWMGVPASRLFGPLTDPDSGGMSMEMKARMSLQKPKRSPMELMLIAATPIVVGLMPLRIRGKAS